MKMIWMRIWMETGMTLTAVNGVYSFVVPEGGKAEVSVVLEAADLLVFFRKI